MKKKYSATSKDKQDWINFTKDSGKIYNKEENFLNSKNNIKKIKKLDLHGFTLENANQKTKDFIIESFNDGCKKLLIITGKGTRSRVANNPYLSEEMSLLKYSIPEFIKNNDELMNKISSISPASIEDGGTGAIYVFLKKHR